MDKFFFRKIWQLALFLIILYILQAFVFPRVVIWGVKPLIIPVAAIGIGFFGGGIRGGVFGLFCGILCDAAFDSAPLFTFLLPLLGLAAGLISKYYLIPGFPSYLLCSFGGLIVISVFQMFSFIVFKNAGFTAVLKTALFQSVYSLFFAILLYWPVRFLSGRK